MRKCFPCLLLAFAFGNTPAAELSADSREQVIEELANLIADNYVEADQGARIAALLREKVENSEDDPYADSASLAGWLTEWLREFDLHFAVIWQPGATPASEGNASNDRESVSQRSNFGFRKVERLPGNIGYLDLRYFEDPSIAGQTAASSMDFLFGSDAIIVDLRQNGGGSPGMVQLLCSYFFDQPTHLNSLYWRPTDQTTQFWTLPHVPGRKSPDTPLFVLISERTGSAAEEFAYNMKTQKRGTLVGRKTAGAANPGDEFDLPFGFRTFISTGKAINPITERNWEGVGVSPDRRASSAQALNIALTLAFEAIEETVSDPVHEKEVRWAKEAHIARTTFPPPPAGVEALTGKYRDRKIELDGDILLYQRGRRSPRVLRPITTNTFVPDGIDNLRIRFERKDDGTGTQLTEEFLDGFQRSFRRED